LIYAKILMIRAETCLNCFVHGPDFDLLIPWFTAWNKFGTKESFRFLLCKVIDRFPLCWFAVFHINKWEREQSSKQMQYKRQKKKKRKKKERKETHLKSILYFLHLNPLQEFIISFVVRSRLCIYFIAAENCYVDFESYK
jgi:hypothetical protein